MITDERLDELFRTWAREQVDAAAHTLHDTSDVVELRPDRVRRSIRTWWVAASVAALLAAALAVGVSIFTGRSDTNHRAAAPGSALYQVWVDPQSRMTVTVEPGSLTVRLPAVGCAPTNEYQVQVSATRLHVNEMSAARASCVGTAGPSIYESKLFDRLGDIMDNDPTWRIVGHELTLTAPNGASITLTRKN